MLKTIRFGERACCRLSYQKRTFLPASYSCEAEWNDRLKSRILTSAKPEELAYKLNQKYNNEGKISAIDVDILANAVEDPSQTEELASILQKFRTTSEAHRIHASTHHAVIRFLLQNDFVEDLLNILHNRLAYGIFPEHHDYNLLMDTFILRNDFASAARVAVLPMLQEDSEHPITNAMSVYSCHRYLEDPDSWQLPKVEEPEKKEEEEEEEVKVRVGFLRNPYFDDHFDLKEPRDLVGKTLAFMGKHMDNAMGRSCHLRGLILYKKYKQALELMDQWMKEKDVQEAGTVYEEVFDLIKKDNAYIPEEQVPEELKTVFGKLETLRNTSTVKESFTDALKQNIEKAVAERASLDTEIQPELYKKWEKMREKALQKQFEELDRQQRLKKVEEMKKYLTEKEKLLTFFDREEEIELEIERKELQEKEEMERVLKIPRSAKKLRKLVQEADYVPPNV